MSTNRIAWWLTVAAIFIPRLIVPDDFFIQDEQPWIDRSQTYVNALFKGDFASAVEYPLSNHPAIPLMTSVGPVMNLYGAYNNLEGTYANWPLDDKRNAAVWARYTWGIVCSIALLFLYLPVSRLSLFRTRKWMAALCIVLLGLEPWIWGISRSVSVDVLMAISIVGSLISAVVAFETKGMQWVFFSGAWFGLAFVSKSPALITAPFACILASTMLPLQWKNILQRIGVWFLGAYIACIIVWPPFLFHPIERIVDVLARAELHSTVQEIYYWPGIHPPLFLFTLSTFATIGCVLYLWNRIRDIQKYGIYFFPLDVVFIAGVWHGAVLLYLHGDHARKNLPVLAILGCIGVIGWIWWMSRRNAPQITTIVGLIVLQGIFVWPYFPHVITSYNVLFPSTYGKRLLVDIGNGSRLAADYINKSPSTEIWATSMDSLITPYLDGPKRQNVRSLPAGGDLVALDPSVTKIIIPTSLPARVGFDPDGKRLLEQLSSQQVEHVLSIRDVTIFLVYSIRHEKGI